MAGPLAGTRQRQCSIDIIVEIAVAGNEQVSGIEQVSKAVAQTDETTQHNAVLVEEDAAVNEATSEQAATLNNLISFFMVAVGAGGSRLRAVKPEHSRGRAQAEV